VLRVKERLRKSNLDFREELSKSSLCKSSVCKSPSGNTAKGKPKQFLFEAELKDSREGDYNLEIEKMKVIKSLKRSHIIKRASQCKLLWSSFRGEERSHVSRLKVTGKRLESGDEF
jgi:hypothetical protein